MIILVNLKLLQGHTGPFNSTLRFSIHSFDLYMYWAFIYCVPDSMLGSADTIVNENVYPS